MRCARTFHLICTPYKIFEYLNVIRYNIYFIHTSSNPNNVNFYNLKFMLIYGISYTISEVIYVGHSIYIASSLSITKRFVMSSFSEFPFSFVSLFVFLYRFSHVNWPRDAWTGVT